MATAYIEIPLSGERARGRITLIDVDDYEVVTSHTWNVSEREKGARPYGPYAVTTVFREDRSKKTTVFLHKLIAGPRQDHANGDGLDNRRVNLRTATANQNMMNRKTWGRSPYNGVSYYGKGLWQARVVKNGVRQRLGLFVDQIEAAKAYDKAARVEYGEFARLNFEDAA